MVPYLRQAYWRWWRLPEIPGTKDSDDLFDPFDPAFGGMFWYDKKLHEETLAAKKKKIKLPPVTIIEETYKMEFLENSKFSTVNS
jgi:microcin C transport system substrate-binding protein